MFDQLMDLVKEYAQEPVIANPEIPNEQNNEIVAEATNTVTSGLQNVMAGGGLQNIIQMFTGGGAGNTDNGAGGLSGILKNPMIAMMIGHFTRKLVAKYNMNPQSAGSVANNLIPNLLQGLVRRTNDPSNNQYDLNSILNALSGSGKSTEPNESDGLDIGNLVNRFSQGGMDIDDDGDVDLQDMIAKFTSRAQNNLQAKSGSSMMNLLKGMTG